MNIKIDLDFTAVDDELLPYLSQRLTGRGGLCEQAPGIGGVLADVLLQELDLRATGARGQHGREVEYADLPPADVLNDGWGAWLWLANEVSALQQTPGAEGLAALLQGVGAALRPKVEPLYVENYVAEELLRTGRPVDVAAVRRQVHEATSSALRRLKRHYGREKNEGV